MYRCIEYSWLVSELRLGLVVRIKVRDRSQMIPLKSLLSVSHTFLERKYIRIDTKQEARYKQQLQCAMHIG